MEFEGICQSVEYHLQGPYMSASAMSISLQGERRKSWLTGFMKEDGFAVRVPHV
jgi:hypothetical protein